MDDRARPWIPETGECDFDDEQDTLTRVCLDNSNGSQKTMLALRNGSVLIASYEIAWQHGDPLGRLPEIEGCSHSFEATEGFGVEQHHLDIPND